MDATGSQRISQCAAAKARRCEMNSTLKGSRGWVGACPVALPPALELHAFTVQRGSEPDHEGSVIFHMQWCGARFSADASGLLALMNLTLASRLVFGHLIVEGF